MWYGNSTKELEMLYNEYYSLFGCEPDSYQEVEYGQPDYDDYVRDIKTAIEEKRELPEVSS